MSEGQHIVKKFDQQLGHVRARLLEMGGMVEQQIREAVKSIEMQDLKLARTVLEGDKPINVLDVEIEEEIVALVALRAPMAGDLRMLMSLSKAATDLERIGDEAHKIARMAIDLCEVDNDSYQHFLRDITSMTSLASQMLRDALDALARLDSRRAVEIVASDSELDAVFDDSFRRLLTYMMEDHRTISRAINVLFVIKALERIGDHSKNIAEYVIYMADGRNVRHQAEASWTK